MMLGLTVSEEGRKTLADLDVISPMVKLIGDGKVILLRGVK
jgi:hypothetical protein